MTSNIDSEYNSTIDWLYELHLFGIKLGLKKVKKLLEYLGNPQDSLKIIHVGGTNGKGSVCTMISSVLAAAGYKVGLNTSPHLSEFTERITINGKQITRAEIIEYANILRDIRERINAETELGYATYFEVVTAMALKYFADNNVDFVVLEVGLGGTYDATNVVTPAVTVITDIALDHTEHLGNTLTSVAENKAGIIKPGRPVVTSNTHPEVIDVLTKTCEKQKSDFYRLGTNIKYEILSSTNKGVHFTYQGLTWDYQDLTTPLLGKYQSSNAALAVGALELLSKLEDLNISEQILQTGLENATWPGRLEVIQQTPIVLLDGAHNPGGAKALADALQLFDFNKLFLVFGCSEEKDINGLLEPLMPLVNKLIVTQADIRRSADPSMILEHLKEFDIEKVVHKSVKSAVKNTLVEAKDNDLVCICGSLFVVGEARELWFPGISSGDGSEKPRIHY